MHTYSNKTTRKEGKNNGCGEGKEQCLCLLSYACRQGLSFIVVLRVGPVTHEELLLVLQVFLESSMPVIKHYEGKGKLRRFDATPPPSEVFEKVKKLFVQTPASVL